MEGRSIIHKMHVLERSFLPELKYSTSHSYRPLLYPGPIPGGLCLSASSAEHPPPLAPDADTNPDVVDHRQLCLSRPFLTRSSSRGFLSLATHRTFTLYELAARSIDRRNLPLNLADENFAMYSSSLLASRCKIIYRGDLWKLHDVCHVFEQP